MKEDFLIKGKIKNLEQQKNELGLRITRYENERNRKKTSLIIELVMILFSVFIASCFFLGKIDLGFLDERGDILFCALLVVAVVIPLILIFTRDLQNYAQDKIDYENDKQEYQRVLKKKNLLERDLGKKQDDLTSGL